MGLPRQSGTARLDRGTDSPSTRSPDSMRRIYKTPDGRAYRDDACSVVALDINFRLLEDFLATQNPQRYDAALPTGVQ